jgi:hypothetical protein
VLPSRPTALIYALGGWNGASALAANGAYNPAANTWVADSPMPNPETDAGVATMASGADDVQDIVRGGMSLGNFLDAGSRAVFRSKLPRALVLEPFLQLRVLAHLLAHFPEIRKALGV